jgi:uncharacterized protein (TIGR04168 family)
MTHNRYPLIKLTMKLVIVGDVHEDWNERDQRALSLLDPDVTLFLGDFGDGDLGITDKIAEVPGPKATILGNHDMWVVQPFKGAKNSTDLAQQQLKVLEESHVGTVARASRHPGSRSQWLGVVRSRKVVQN